MSTRSHVLYPKNWNRIFWQLTPVLKTSVFKPTFSKNIQTAYSLHHLSSVIIYNCWQHCFVKLLPAVPFLISVQSCFCVIYYIFSFGACLEWHSRARSSPACHHLSNACWELSGQISRAELWWLCQSACPYRSRQSTLLGCIYIYIFL